MTDEILNVLKSSPYLWRTVKGLSTELNMPETEVKKHLEHVLVNDVIRSVQKNQNDDSLYALRKRYHKETPLLDQFLDFLVPAS